jgi:hypothetical protein
MEGGVAALVDALVFVRPRCLGGPNIFVRLDCQRGRSTRHVAGRRCRFVRAKLHRRMLMKTFVEWAQEISYTRLTGTIRYAAHESAYERLEAREVGGNVDWAV